MLSQSKSRCRAVAVGAMLAIATFSQLLVAAPELDLSSDRRARKFASASKTPLRSGQGDCKTFAEHYPTLGSAVTWHGTRANVENVVHCTRGKKAWVCKATFVYNDRKVSERDWALFLEFSVDWKTAAVLDLKCSGAG